MVLKNELNHNFGVRAVLNWGHFAGSLPLRSLSQCFKVGDCATIILYCPFYAKVSLSFYIPLKSKAILEHLILFNLFTLAAEKLQEPLQWSCVSVCFIDVYADLISN